MASNFCCSSAYYARRLLSAAIFWLSLADASLGLVWPTLGLTFSVGFFLTYCLLLLGGNFSLLVLSFWKVEIWVSYLASLLFSSCCSFRRFLTRSESSLISLSLFSMSSCFLLGRGGKFWLDYWLCMSSITTTFLTGLPPMLFCAINPARDSSCCSWITGGGALAKVVLTGECCTLPRPPPGIEGGWWTGELPIWDLLRPSL